MTETATTTDTRTYTIRESRVGELMSLLKKPNTRLEKAGLPTFVPQVISREDRTNIVGGIEVIETFVTFTLNEWKLTLGDFTFVASLVPEEAGMTVHTAPGQSLEGWVRPAADDMSCDHCQTKRFRNRLYVVRNDVTGELIQLGHNCIQLYTGIEPKGLWALEFDADLREFSDSDNEGFGGFHRDSTISIRSTLALAYVLSNGGRGYVSKAKADEWDKPSTIALMKEHLNNPPKNPGSSYSSRDPHALSDYLAYQETCAKVVETSKDDALIEAILASVESVKAGTDYGDNLRIIVAAESGRVSERNMGILASLVSVYRRELDKQAERTATPAVTGFLGVKGDKLTNLTLTVKTVKVWDGDYGTSTLIVGTAPTGHTVVWKASRFINLEAGDTLVIKSGTVKETEHKYGADQTILTRCRVDENL